MGAVSPVIRLSPGRDTVVDSTGVLQVHVQVVDLARLRLVDLLVLDAQFSFSPVAPNDSVLDASFPFALSRFKHTTFRYYVRASDIFDHETVSDTVAVTVR
jgi:hypothetical protein